MNLRAAKYALVTTLVVMTTVVVVLKAFWGKNSASTWQYVESLDGTVFIQNGIGWYYKGLATVTEYSNVIEVEGTKAKTAHSKGGDAANVSFNDGGSSDLDYYARVTTPRPEGHEEGEALEKIHQQQREFHRLYGNEENVRIAVRSHIRDCIGRTGNIMSASEEQAHRYSEFYDVSFQQIRDGYIRMKPVVIRRKTGVAALAKAAEAASQLGDAAKGKEAPTTSMGASIAQQAEEVVGESSVEASDTVRASEVVWGDDGKPVIDTVSPIKLAGMGLVQYSIMKTDYDPATQTQFKAKRDLLLQAETARALTVKAVQERLGNIAKGNLAIAQKEATANQEKARKVIAAQITQEVEGVRTGLMEVKGKTKVLVKEVLNKQLLAEQQTAEYEAQTAENTRLAAEVTAKATEQKIGLAGAVSDAEQKLQDIYTEQTESIAESMGKVLVPDTVFIPLDSVPEGVSPLSFALPSLRLLESAGLTGKLKDTVESDWKPAKDLAPMQLPVPAPKPAPVTTGPVTDSAAPAKP